jgi:hypothetical protein
MKAHSTPGLTLVHRIGIIPFRLRFEKTKKPAKPVLTEKEKPDG